jgi:hypothetical protein
MWGQKYKPIVMYTRLNRQPPADTNNRTGRITTNDCNKIIDDIHSYVRDCPTSGGLK